MSKLLSWDLGYIDPVKFGAHTFRLSGNLAEAVQSSKVLKAHSGTLMASIHNAKPNVCNE